MEYQIVFVYGLIFGSYFHQVAIREWERGLKRVNASRSSCDQCGFSLGIRDLIPLVSFIILRGKCRSCQTPLSILYPLSELLTGGLFVLAYYRNGFTQEIFFELALWSMLVIFALMDVYYFKISNRLLLLFGLLLIILTPLSARQMILGGLMQVFIFFIASIFGQSGIGMGDIKLMVLLGLVVGYWPSLLILCLASITALIFMLIQPRQKLPFVPFIMLASLVISLLAPL